MTRSYLRLCAFMCGLFCLPLARAPRHQQLLNHGANRHAFRHSHGIRVVQSPCLRAI